MMVFSRSISISLDKRIDNSLIAISPNANIVLFSSQTPEKLVFLAELCLEPISHYTTRSLNISIDYDEHITSLLCLPCMSTQRTSLRSIDWTALVIGYSSGYVKFYTEQSICLLSLKFCDEPVINIKLQTQKNNSNARSQIHFASIVDELLIVYKSCAIVIDGIGLHENLRISKEDVVKHGSSEYEPAYTLANLPIILTCQKWNFDNSKQSRVMDAELLGTRIASRFDILRTDSINYDNVPTKSCSRTLALVGVDPFITCYREAKEVIAHSYTEMITSLLPFWGKPQPTKFQMNEISKSSDLCLFDKDRLANSIVASPDKRLAAVTDDFGRVMLLDVTNWLVVRIWKGYRNAQCGWVEVKRDPEEKNTMYASFLVIYAPKRGLLEIWSAQRGPRVAAYNVGKNCRLLYSGYRMLNMRAEPFSRISNNPCSTGSSLLVDQSYSTNCYLFNAQNETICFIDIPYTYSLYKYGDLKSRDHLLIGELKAAINQDAEVSSITAILNRVALAESLEICIQKIANDSDPQKLVSILENLIIKIMKNYDNSSGGAMSDDDASIVDLCKRIILLCTMFQELSDKSEQHTELSTLDVNQRLIEEYPDHPREVDEFAERLGWSAAEVLRYLSLLTLEQSYRKSKSFGPLFGHSYSGEPLNWSDFVSCFDISRFQVPPEKISFRLRELNNKFLNGEKLIKTALFLFLRLGVNYHRSSVNSSADVSESSSAVLSSDYYNYIQPSSRLALLFQFWLSTKLCNHWKMWVFLQDQVGRISDELRVGVMANDNDEKLLIDSWKLIYHLILESNNIFAAIIATTVIKSDTLRMLSDEEKREKLERAKNEGEQKDEERSLSVIDWECLCIDAERMSLLSQQLEDVFLLSLLLNYSHADKRVVERTFVYRIPRISVANILRSGPTVVSELVAQWATQMHRNENLDLKIFTQEYGSFNDAATIASDSDQATKVTVAAEPRSSTIDDVNRKKHQNFLPRYLEANNDSIEDQVKELLHHVKISFPHSLDRDIILLYFVWESCQRWTNGSLQSCLRSLLLQRAIDALSLLSCPLLQHNAASMVFKSFFKKPFERLCVLIETNATILSPKCSRSRDTLARRELNMSEDCLEDLVRFCCNFSEFLLQTYRDKFEKVEDESTKSGEQDNEESQQNKLLLQQEQLSERLLCLDDWWSTPTAPVAEQLTENNTNKYHFDSLQDTDSTSVMRSDYYAVCSTDEPCNSHTTTMRADMARNNNGATLVQATLSIEKLFSIEVLLELDHLALLMDLIFKLKIIKSYPLTLIGEDSRQILKLDLQQSSTTGTDIQLRSGSLPELRHKFARRCIVHIVAKLTEDLPSMLNEFEDVDSAMVAQMKQQQLASASDESTSTSGNDLFARRRLPMNSSSRGTALVKSLSSAVASGKVQKTTITSSVGSNDCDADAVSSQSGGGGTSNSTHNYDLEQRQLSQANNESTLLFANLLSLSTEWQLNCDELQLEFVFELFRCNHDKLAKQLIIRVQDKQMLASGLLKICSQRVLVLFGLSVRLSSMNQWRQRVDKWSMFQPNISSWLKSVQNEELQQELAELNFSTPSNELKSIGIANDAKSADSEDDESGAEMDEAFVAHIERALGLRMFVLKALHWKTKSVLELVTNYLDGQAGRLAYDLLQLLESRLFDRHFLPLERELWLKQRAKD